MKKSIILILSLASIIFSSQVLAEYEDPILTVRQLPSTEYEAVVSYRSRTACSLSVNPPFSVQVEGTNISVDSPYFAPEPCITTPPPPSYFIEQTANLGELAAGEYTITWVQVDNFSLTTVFEVSGWSSAATSIVDPNPYPETGLWYNPDQSGTGFDLEFQGGIMAGHYFGYDADGQPEWYLVSKTLTASLTPGVMWEMMVQPERYTGGNCLGCTYQQPNDPELLAPIKIEFLERAKARLTLGDGSVQYMQPIIFGDVSTPVVTNQMTQNLPAFFSGSSEWVVTFSSVDESSQSASTWSSDVLSIAKPETPDSGSNSGSLVYSVDMSAADASASFSEIVCTQTNEPVCNLITEDGTEYQISIGDFTDTRFFAKSANGDSVQGFRLSYD